MNDIEDEKYELIKVVDLKNTLFFNIPYVCFLSLIIFFVTLMFKAIENTPEPYIRAGIIIVLLFTTNKLVYWLGQPTITERYVKREIKVINNANRK